MTTRTDQIDEGFLDVDPATDTDADGYTLCSIAGAPFDCNDQLAFVHPEAPELCNGIDDDCDGKVDEEIPGTGESCDTGLPGVCADGTTECSGGTLQCLSLQSSPEVCDNLDNDCDGTVDEDVPGTGESCDTGLPGVCADGVTQCVDGSLTCLASVEPTAEICDNLDNDCDGTPDDDVAGTGESCDTGLPGVCADGTSQCSEGSLTCLASVEPTAEICDNLDNDCDGTPDDESRVRARAATRGSWASVPPAPPSARAGV